MFIHVYQFSYQFIFLYWIKIKKILYPTLKKNREQNITALKILIEKIIVEQISCGRITSTGTKRIGKNTGWILSFGFLVKFWENRELMHFTNNLFFKNKNFEIFCVLKFIYYYFNGIFSTVLYDYEFS